MKNTVLFLLISGLLVPISGLAHPGSHHEHNGLSILGHFFSEPDHVLMLMLVIGLLLCPLWLAPLKRLLVSKRRLR